MGYERACYLLREKYGKPHVITRSYIDSLTSGTQLKASEVKGLTGLSEEMQKCELTLQRLGYMTDINSTETLRAIVKHLPFHIRAKSVDRAALFTESGENLIFQIYVGF